MVFLMSLAMMVIMAMVAMRIFIHSSLDSAITKRIEDKKEDPYE